MTLKLLTRTTYSVVEWHSSMNNQGFIEKFLVGGHWLVRAGWEGGAKLRLTILMDVALFLEPYWPNMILYCLGKGVCYFPKERK